MADFTIPSTLIPGTAAATSYDLPNYLGELFDLMPQVTKFWNLIATNGGRDVRSRDFVWEIEDGEPSGATNQRVENASVTGDLVPRQPVSNVVEIHQEAVDFGYTAQAVIDQIATDAPVSASDIALDGDQPVKSPMQHQINKKILKIKRDLNTTFINGTYHNPGTNATARRTRGILEAITTHAINYFDGVGGKGTAYTSLEQVVEDILLDMVAPTVEAETAVMQDIVFLMNPKHRRGFSSVYSADGALAPRDRKVGGVALERIVTDHGEFYLSSERYIPVGTLLIVDLSVLRPVFLPIPGKGVFFVEPLGKTGATDKAQIYGEVGLEYGPETYHGKVTTLPTSF
ncbi:MAG: DUF5309 family protein [Actinomycetota bacterium]